jgi:hypothetical protein
MKDVKIGLRFSEESGISFFGLEEVNLAIEEGKKVISVKEGNVIMHKSEVGESIDLVIKGFSISVSLE